MALASGVVSNLGRRPGVAVPQLYVALPSSGAIPQPPAQLKGFTRVSLAPGASKRFTIALDERALSYWDTRTQNWRPAPGCYRVLVGSSSRSLPLQRRRCPGA